MKKIKRKILFYKHVIIEVLETLCTICLFLEEQAYCSRSRNQYAIHLRSHFDTLSAYARDMIEDFPEKND